MKKILNRLPDFSKPYGASHKYVANIRLNFLYKLSLKPSLWNFRTWSWYWWTAETSLSFLNTHFRVQILWVSDLSPNHAFWFSFRDHLCLTTGIINGRGSFQVLFGDHLRHGLGIIYDRGSFTVLYKCKFNSEKIGLVLTDWATPNKRDQVWKNDALTSLSWSLKIPDQGGR